MWELLHRRADDTFVIKYANLPYHVIPSDPLYEAVAAAAEGVELQPEPALQVPAPTPVLQPTRAELMAQLLRIQAQIEALP